MIGPFWRIAICVASLRRAGSPLPNRNHGLMTMKVVTCWAVSREVADWAEIERERDAHPEFEKITPQVANRRVYVSHSQINTTTSAQIALEYSMELCASGR